MIKILSRSLRENKKPAILTMIFMVLEAVMETIIPFITALLVNQIKEGTETRTIALTGLLLVGMAVLSLGCAAAAGVFAAKASTGFGKNLRKDMFDKIQEFSFENIDKFSTASLVTRLTVDVGYVRQAFMMIIRTAVRSPLMFIFSIVMSTIMGGMLAVSFVVVVPILIIGLLWVAKKAMPAFRRVFKKYDKLNESIEENVRGMRVVKGFAREEFEKEKLAKASEDIRQDFTKAERIVAFNTPLMNLCMYINMVVILFVGSMLAVKYGGTKIDVGQISSMLVYAMQLLMSLMMLSMIYVMITMSTESAKRICEVLTETPAILNPQNPVMEVKDGSITFNKVTFKYAKTAEDAALEEVNLKIESGMTVGILGGTGSSKTTLVQLIPRLYDVTEGELLVGGVNVKDYDLTVLRDSVAMVLQKNLLFSGTIRENLCWGNPHATDEEIIEASKLAQADEFVQTFPDKYDTYIEQGGTNVSGGQKQRLCIARALLKKPKILILDDSTSAVDMKTDALIREGFKKYIPETTKIIIAQRVASVMDADLIIILDDGKIVDMGKHEELLATSSIYKEVYEQQTNGGDDHDE
ncbi:MAG: ABC transporter ATP-binding protein [Bacilli bacterium]|nr:ABC transporter ATP-binding protein [Bacilli bacterium]